MASSATSNGGAIEQGLCSRRIEQLHCMRLLPAYLLLPASTGRQAHQPCTSLPPSPLPGPCPPCHAPTALQNAGMSDLDRISLSNVLNGSPKMWAHVVTVYVITYIVLKVSCGQAGRQAGSCE